MPCDAMPCRFRCSREARQALQKDIFGVATAASYCSAVTDAAEMVMDSLAARKGEEVKLHDVVVNAVADVFTAAVLGKAIGMSDGTAREEERKWVHAGMRTGAGGERVDSRKLSETRVRKRRIRYLST